MKKRILAFDVGDARIGVAVSDPMGLIATPLEYIKNTGKKSVASEVEKLLREYDVNLIVVGMPLHMNSDFGESAKKSKAFGDYLSARFAIPVAYQDERLTTVMANSALIECNVRRENRKKYIDSLSAALILESYMNGKNMEE